MMSAVWNDGRLIKLRRDRLEPHGNLTGGRDAGWWGGKDSVM